jgi:hypothetical protein
MDKFESFNPLSVDIGSHVRVIAKDFIEFFILGFGMHISD